ncbi:MULTISPECIES: CheB methylesterase domain-containing protein [unclassified Methanoculleus]|uniref:CheB methylesterase domain-containing protein n=1 Tax=unclassified Methanoculleus TaxID=2619537 RepID=UPI0025E3441D|nr:MULTISPECIES: CheB methylesterase domain-containing protein [unclassified Methanoculleus]MCK9317175.1 CheB methylesterase domain-containing protein [Methanoculleus sp.]MDD2253747.1 CheB methylesterase domain-containing protein [Methanoculleus sp.]MDD2788095.1 CheB methylesterase domain-containing protein [Methanoculleus sp.]MDD3216607.1 CheB methylesterase domain-containing protein [Methanoculleus sp.]MDD4314630.1 CheB methylesterase domain-containing protein [Methanoculleus sp.]
MENPEPDGPDRRTIVVIGSSTGGPRTLEAVFSRFPLVNVAIIVVQHMPQHINSALCRHIEEISRMNVKVGEDGETVEHGTIYVAPSEIHLELLENRTIHLFDDEKVRFARPSIDVAMRSLERNGDDRIVGVILSGMGSDGAEGIRHIKAIGGITLAQTLRTCAIHAMPRAAFETGKVDLMLPPEGIREQIIRIARIL